MHFSYVYSVWLILIITSTVHNLSFIPIQEWNVGFQVSTRSGTLQGHNLKAVHGKDYYAYEGIPYARPPIGNLRFRSPRPMVKWKGILNATKVGSNCIELRGRLTGFILDGNEDCLYLNVYSPISPINVKKSYPVIFFIYGGAFLDGLADIYEPDYLIEQELVVVTFNYRLNVFGFLSTQDEASPGNYGLKDQNLALRWVKNNIKKFGGNPKKVTISGQSAGACSVMYHIVSPKSKGLFSSAIAISGDSLTPWSHQREPEKVANDFGLYFGIETDNSSKLIEHMRRLDTEQLKRAVINIVIANGLLLLNNGLPFTPVIESPSEEAFVTELSFDSLKNGRFNRVPLMIGFTTSEVNFFIEAIELARPILLLQDLSPSSIPTPLNIQPQEERRIVGEKIKNKYFNGQPISSASSEELVEYFDDIMYVRSITQTVRLASQYTPVYFYVYKKEFKQFKRYAQAVGYPIDLNLKGPAHGEDLTCIWNFLSLDLASEAVDFCIKMRKIWKNFATYGKPTLSRDPSLQNISWTPVDDQENISYLSIDDNMSMEHNYRQEFISFWDDIFKNYTHWPYYTY